MVGMFGLLLLGVFGAHADDVVNAASDQDESSFVQVKWHAMTPVKQTKPVVPPFAKLPRPIVCKLRYTVDSLGNTTEVAPVECPDAMQANAIKAGMKWRFEPVMVDGVATPVQFNMILKITH